MQRPPQNIGYRIRRALGMELVLLAATPLFWASWSGCVLYLGTTVILPAAFLWAPAHHGVLTAFARARAWLRATYAALLAAARALVEILVPVSSPAPARLVDDLPPALQVLVTSFSLRAPPLLA
jgi:hypothetical protein